MYSWSTWAQTRQGNKGHCQDGNGHHATVRVTRAYRHSALTQSTSIDGVLTRQPARQNPKDVLPASEFERGGGGGSYMMSSSWPVSPDDRAEPRSCGRLIMVIREEQVGSLSPIGVSRASTASWSGRLSGLCGPIGTTGVHQASIRLNLVGWPLRLI